MYHLADLSKPEGVEKITKKVKTPDLIIANAGITMFGEVGSIDKEDRKDLFYLLCNGVIDLIEAYVPNMVKMGEGRIVIISSIGAITPMPKSSIYASAKSAIYSYGQSLSQELSSKNISVTVSLPGYVKTEAHSRAGLNHLRKKIPSWMWIDAERVVTETEMASLKGKSSVIPGKIYKLVRPFLGMSLATSIWNKITRRNKTSEY
jgi:Short-chain dehydrogenases of various substrate specificities